MQERERGQAVLPLPSPVTVFDSKEESIIQRCREGDKSAFHEIYTRYERPLLSTAFRMLGHRQDAEDAVHETFLKLYRHIGRFRIGSKFSTYLFRILLNSCFDMLRDRKRRATDSIDVDFLAYQPHEESLFHLERTFNSLPVRMRACFILFAVEEFKLEEVGEMLGLRLGTVKATIHRARARLRSILMDAGSSEDSKP